LEILEALLPALGRGTAGVLRLASGSEEILVETTVLRTEGQGHSTAIGASESAY